ncbi:unnamed protein product [Gongylonema pulchrum]|uniref:Uncharacterized protein n=1 Tax=Gongylonema pulchrum TaxID=637853 RepID=A0A3P6RYA7_9BILA|nr:unnamed protein product [Gongylonema pulchrum]
MLCDDLNDWLSRQGKKPLYGFMEDNRWKKVGDVYVPVDDIIDLTSCEPSVEIETLPVKYVNFYANLDLSAVAMVYLEEVSTTIFMGQNHL